MVAAHRFAAAAQKPNTAATGPEAYIPTFRNGIAIRLSGRRAAAVMMAIRRRESLRVDHQFETGRQIFCSDPVAERKANAILQS
jgi:hypothetical protein